jgi:ketosteroid isomerase-like protein
MSDRRAELARLVEDFTECFNANDLDRLMTYFTDDAVYEEINGPINHGKAAIRKAFEPLFSGKFGQVNFAARDLFVDLDADKVMASWDLRLLMEGQPKKLEGLDLYHFRGDKIVRKLAYSKARQPRYVDDAEVIS